MIEQQEILLNNLNNIYSSYRKGADLDETDTIDPEDLSHEDEWSGDAQELKERIDNAQKDMDVIKSLPLKEFDEVTDGCVVFTPEINFIMGTAVAEFEFEDQRFIGIATDAPIYGTMQNLKAGDTFVFGDNQFTIETIL